MKKFTAIKVLNPYIMAIFLFIGCSKELPESSSSGAYGGIGRVSPVATNNTPGTPAATGTFSIEALPARASAAIILTRNRETYGYFAPTTNGIHTACSVAPGVYSVYLHPLNLDYSGYVIADIEIVANKNTDLGTITLRRR